MSLKLVLRSACAGALLAPALALTPQELQAALPAQVQQPGAYVEVPGELEFTGVLCARPLQAAQSDLTTRELDERVSRGLDMVAELVVRRYVPETDEYLIEVPAGETENTLSQRLMKTGGFQYVEPDWLVYPVGCPNDSSFGTQWHHEANRMQSCDAWDIETGDPSIVVAICDTGIRLTHEDLQLHRYDGYHAPSQTWQASGGPIDDINGHGTLCSGTAAANGNNGVGVSGVGWNLGHRTMRVTDSGDGSASLSNLTDAARTAALAGDKVASVSYSGGSSGSVDTAGGFIRNNGALLIWAAGNSSTVMSGNRDDNVILVGATTSSDSLAGYSNRGPLVDFAAPGSQIRTTSSSGNSSYSSVSGTSFACPMTAGLCGLIWSRNPDLTPAEVEQILRDSCDDLGASGVDDTFGYGRINSLKAMQMTPSPSVAIAFPFGRPDVVAPQGGDTVVVRVTPGADSVDPSGVRFYLDAGTGFVPVVPSISGGPVYDFTATFPPTDCPNELRYYFEFPLNSGGVIAAPGGGASSPYIATAIETVTLAEDDLENTSGWTVGAPGDNATTGIWELVDPNGTDAAPSDDNTPGGTLCYVTGQGSAGGSLGQNDVDNGTTTLISPAWDISGYSNPSVGYSRWFSNNLGSTTNDAFVIDASGDGGSTWVNVETLGPQSTSGGWGRNDFLIADLLPNATTLSLRFIASDLGDQGIVEAAVDDIEFFESCPNNCGVSTYCVTTPNSVGPGARIGYSGSASIVDNDLELLAFGAPSQVFSGFIYSPDRIQQSTVNGTLCIGSATLGFFGRTSVVQTDGLGFARLSFDNTAAPLPPLQVNAGETWNFQFVHRDLINGQAAFRYSDGLSVTFCP